MSGVFDVFVSTKCAIWCGRKEQVPLVESFSRHPKSTSTLTRSRSLSVIDDCTCVCCSVPL